MAEPTESSPLLPAEAEGSNGAAGLETFPSPGLSDHVPAREHFKRPIKILTTVILVVGIIDFILIVGTDVIVYWGPFLSGGSRYSTTNYLEFLGIGIFLAFVLAILNTRYVIYHLLNIIFDIILAYAIISSSSALVNDYQGWPRDYGWCSKGDYQQPGTKPTGPHCKAWKLAVEILIRVIVGLGGVVGVAQLVLFVLRVIAGFRTRFWERPLGLFFPTGELTVSFTIKVLKQQPPVETASPSGPAVQVTSS